MTFLYLQSKIKVRNCCTLIKSVACRFRAVSSIYCSTQHSIPFLISHSWMSLFGWSHFQLDFNPISKWKLYSTDVPACSVQPIVWSPRSEQINLDCVCRFLESKLSFFLHVKFSKCMSMHTLPLSTRICLYFLWYFTAGRW